MFSSNEQKSERKKSRVVFVDDEPAFLEMYSAKFLASGFEVKTYSNTAEVFAGVLEFKPDIIFLDLVMKDSDGVVLLKELKSAVQTKWVPVVMLSNIDNEADKKRCEQEGSSQFLVKSSFTPGDLLEYTRKILKMV